MPTARETARLLGSKMDELQWGCLNCGATRTRRVFVAQGVNGGEDEVYHSWRCRTAMVRIKVTVL